MYAKRDVYYAKRDIYYAKREVYYAKRDLHTHQITHTHTLSLSLYSIIRIQINSFSSIMRFGEYASLF